MFDVKQGLRYRERYPDNVFDKVATITGGQVISLPDDPEGGTTVLGEAVANILAADAGLSYVIQYTAIEEGPDQRDVALQIADRTGTGQYVIPAITAVAKRMISHLCGGRNGGPDGAAIARGP